MKRKVLLIYLLIVSLFMILPTKVIAEAISTTEELTAEKIATKDVEKVGEYDINISVPGYEKETVSGYNILFVVDASTSTDNVKWPAMRASILETVEAILPESDSSLNVNSVGLITFGIGSHLNIELTNDKSKFYNLPEKIGGSLLLPGRSATNNEVGLKGAHEYLSGVSIASNNGNYITLTKEMMKDKQHTYVIYLTDGESNLNETSRNWYKISSNINEQTGEYYYQSLSTRLSSGKNQSVKVNGDVRSFQRTSLLQSIITYHLYKDSDNIIVNNDYYHIYQEILPLYQELLGNNTQIKETYEYELYNKLIPSTVILGNIDSIDVTEQQSTINGEIVTNEQAKLEIEKNNKIINLNNKLDECIDELFRLIGYDKTKNYSAGEYESMVNVYSFSNQEAFDQEAENLFYFPIFKEGSSQLINATRTIEMGKKLKELATIYTVGFGNMTRNDAKKIMDPEYPGSGDYTANTYETHYSSGYYKATTENINNVLKELTADITRINYKNPTVIDYTSKWVNPIDTNDDGVFNELDITITNNDIVVDNALIKVEKLTKEEIESSKDSEINSNTNGDIYKITWTITNYLHSWDKYQLTYRVKVDNQESNFISKKEYNANGETTLTYDIVEIAEIDVDGITEIQEKIIKEKVKYNITVPKVSQKENIIIITKKDEEENLISGADFEIASTEGTNQIVKEYSIDGINWTITNTDNKATYFKFSGMYDYEYIIKETKTPKGYIKDENEIQINFDNKEGRTENQTVINIKKDSIPQTLKETNTSSNLGIAIIWLIGMISTSTGFKRRKILNK